MLRMRSVEATGEVVLNVAAAVAGMGREQQRAIDRGLAVPGGVQELRELLDTFYRLAGDERAAVIAALREHTPLRVCRISGQ